LGHHADIEAPQPEIPEDLPPHETGDIPSPAATTTVVPDTTFVPAATTTVAAAPPPPPPPPQESGNTEQTPPADDEAPKGKLHKWWEWIASTFEDAKDKLKGMFGKGKDSPS
jgi:hypothetical protein